MRTMLAILMALCIMSSPAYSAILIWNGVVITGYDSVYINGGDLERMASAEKRMTSLRLSDSIDSTGYHNTNELLFFNVYRGYGEHEILNVSLYDGKYLYVEYRNNVWLNDSRPYFRDIYGVVDGKIALIKTIEAITIPALPERVEWPEDK